MSSTHEKTRGRHYHGGVKGKLTGNTVQPAPAWRARNLPAESSDPGSKILFSNLPVDVSEEEIIDLMKKTIGPVNLRESFIVHSSKGVPRGMAIIAFARGVDALKARGRYNGKVIDGKRAVKIEVILDQDLDASQPSIVTSNGAKAQQKPKSLFDRLSPVSPSPNTRQPKGPPPNKRQPSLLERTRLAPIAPSRTQPPVAPRKRQKKGPKRVKKGSAEPVQKPVQKSAADLDREMEDYVAGRANGETPSMKSL